MINILNENFLTPTLKRAGLGPQKEVSVHHGVETGGPKWGVFGHKELSSCFL